MAETASSQLLAIFLPLWFYVKSILADFRRTKLQSWFHVKSEWWKNLEIYTLDFLPSVFSFEFPFVKFFIWVNSTFIMFLVSRNSSFLQTFDVFYSSCLFITSGSIQSPLWTEAQRCTTCQERGEDESLYWGQPC